MTTLTLDGQTVAAGTGDVGAPTIAPGVSDQIPVDDITPNPQQPRQEFDQTALDELAASIKEHGVIQPIVVEIQAADSYILHDGERRWRAAKLAGLATIPAYVLAPGADPKALLLRAVVANVQRADLNPIELAQSYQKMKDDFGMSDADIAQAVGKSRSSVANTRRLLHLPEERQAQVNAGDLSERQAAALLPLYRLPEKVQQKMTSGWQGRELAQPSNLTSDQIRDKIKAGLSYVSRKITAWRPEDTLSGINVHQPRCTDCGYYLKNDNQPLCLDQGCFDQKQDIVTTRQLQAAAAIATSAVRSVASMDADAVDHAAILASHTCSISSVV